MVWEKEGPRGFMKGNLISCTGVAPFVALRQSIFDFQVNSFSNYFFSVEDIRRRSSTYMAYELSSGALAGFVAISVCYPFDILRRMMQLNGLQSQHKYDGITDLLQQVHRRDGMKGFYKGFTATCMKVVPSTAILFILNDKIKSFIMSEEELMSGFVPLSESSADFQKNNS